MFAAHAPRCCELKIKIAKFIQHIPLSLHTHLPKSDNMTHLWLAIIFWKNGTMHCRRFDNLESVAWGNRIDARLWYSMVTKSWVGPGNEASYANSWSTQVALSVSSPQYIKMTTAANYISWVTLTLLRVCFLSGFFLPSKMTLTSLLAPLFPVPMAFSMSEVMKRDIRSILAHDACRISHVRFQLWWSNFTIQYPGVQVNTKTIHLLKKKQF